MKKRTSIIAAGVFLLIAGMLAWSLKSAHDNERNNSDGDGGSIESIADGEASENQTEKEAYELKIIEMDEQEKEETLKKLFSFMESCKNIYESTIKEGNTDEDALHGMIEVGAKKGLSVACGNRDYNLSNYEQVDAALRDALSGKEGEKLNMCKAMEDWKEELLQQGFKEKKNVVKYEKMYRRKVGIKWN